MRAVKFTGYGGPEVLDVVEVARPAAGPGQVVVAVQTAAANPGEIGIREGHFAAIWPAHFPEGQGNDFAGKVAEVGSGVDDFAVGDEVIGFAPRAAQAEYVAVGVDAIAAKHTPPIWAELADLVARGDITVPIAAVYDFTTEQVRQAYRDVGTRHVSGKRVLRIMAAHHQKRQI